MARKKKARGKKVRSVRGLHGQSCKIVTTSRPFNADKFILISAGYDGEYGTADDVCNFDWKYDDIIDD